MDKAQENETDNTEREVRVPCEVYSRIVGYLRPTQNWNAAKQQEFRDRETFDRAVHHPDAA
jgi:anaerobic ribonucleoside-triphosphate reductase